MISKIVPALFVLLLFTLTAAAQKTIRGIVTDASNGETLPSANISIENTYRGTISNNNGNYVLSIPDSLLPATVVVRYLGFHTQERVIDAHSNERQDFNMEPSTLELGEITVTDEDPAIGIMEEVIRRKQEWRKRLETYRAEAYTRQTVSNDTAIVMITESVSEAFWDDEKGHREVLKSRRQTANLESSQNFAGVSYFPNFYDDNIEISGFDVVGVTHPDALKFYNFELVDYKNIDDRIVYEIKVTPARKLQPLFKGTIYVLDGEYALLEVSLQPNEVVKFPPPVKDFNTCYGQQFNNFGKNFWLPVDMRIDGDIKISMIGLEFPLIRFRQISQIRNYEVNVPLPDSLYRKDDLFSIDSTTINNDSLFVRTIESVPLTTREQKAYSSLDSTATLEKAFKPSGFLARFVDMDDRDEDSARSGLLSNIPGSVTPSLRFNRVEEFYLGGGYKLDIADNLELRIKGGYGTGHNQWSWGGGITSRLWRTNRTSLRLGGSYSSETASRYHSVLYRPVMSSISNLSGARQYFDYYRREGYELFTRFDFRPADLSARIAFSSFDHSPLQAVTAYDVFGKNRSLQLNPAIDEGMLNSIRFSAGYNLNEGYSYGVTGFRQIRVGMEQSADWLGSDFDFTRYQASVFWSFSTFYQRRFLSNTLDVNITAGTHSGDLPLQKLAFVDGAMGVFSPFGSLKTIRNRPYEGEQYVSIVAEHNFRTIPFELLGLLWLADQNMGIIVFGGAARTWVSGSYKQSVLNEKGYVINNTGDVHLETGISLNGFLGLFRIDFAQRLDEPAFLINISLARLF